MIESPTSDDRQGLSGKDVTCSRLLDSTAVESDAKNAQGLGRLRARAFYFRLACFIRDL